MRDQPDSTLQAAQHDVQRMLGVCLLRLQGYERGLKAILAHHLVSVSAGRPDPAQTSAGTQTERRTLGQLVGQLFGTYLVTGEPGPLDKGTEAEAADGLRITARIQVSLSTDDYARTETALRELVDLRNRLVHHFLDEHGLGNEAGCQRALESLTAAQERIKHHLDALSQWAGDLDALRQHLGDTLKSKAFRDFVVDGLAPDGGVHWPIAGIVGALREAAAALGEGGWTRLDRAIPWIAIYSPDQQPGRYGCRTWPQVLHQSGLFELRYEREAGQRVAFYRPRGKAGSA